MPSVPHDPKGEFALRRLGSFILLVASIATCLAMLVFAPGASAKAVGGCPVGFELVTIQSLGISPETASGIPSLDGNGDALTCVVFLTVSENATISGAFIFRDNTVMGGRG